MRGWEGFSKYVRYEVGDGSTMCYLHDLWCLEQPLNLSYLELLNIGRCKDAWVVDHMQFRNAKIFIEIFSLQDLCFIGM
jgi:hypothetical protein